MISLEEADESIRLSDEQLTALIIQDVFQGDNQAMDQCLEQLAQMKGVDYSSLSTEDQQNLIIENEDELYSLSDQYNAA